MLLQVGGVGGENGDANHQRTKGKGLTHHTVPQATFVRGRRLGTNPRDPKRNMISLCGKRDPYFTKYERKKHT